MFFKSKKHPDILRFLLILEKESFYNYIIQNELYGLLKKWLNEQYLCKAGTSIPSTIKPPVTFDDGLNSLFRQWTFEPQMMEKISPREKDVIKNDFAKLGLFESREAKNVQRKLNRIFSTHTFNENINVAVKKDEITKFIIDNKIVHLLCENFIDHDFIMRIIGLNSSHPMNDELVLVETLKSLMSKDTTLEDFANIMNITTDYIKKHDKSFDENRSDLMLINGTVNNSFDDFQKVAESNVFVKNLLHKLTSHEELPTIEELLEKFHSIKLDYIRQEFSNSSADNIPSFDDPQIENSYGEKFELNKVHYVQRYQGVYATYSFIVEMLRNSLTISRPLILNGCDEVARLALNNPHDEKLVAHVMAFLETFDVDTRNLRCLVRLLRLKNNQEMKGFEKFVNEKVTVSSSENDLKNVEALEVFWRVKKYKNPSRGYLTPFLETDDWFRLVLLAQYFNYSLEDFVSICETRIKNKNLRDNLIRAVSFDIPENKRHCSFTKRRRSKNNANESQELFKGGKFLDNKHDLFAILLKCSEDVSRVELPFNEFQKYFLRKNFNAKVDDLLYYAKKYDWPLLAVLAGTTSLYRVKYCWLTWLILSCDFKLTKKYDTLEELAKSVVIHSITTNFIETLDESLQIFYPKSAMKIFTQFLRETKNGKFSDSILKLFIVKLNEDDFRMVVAKGKK